MHPSLEQIEAKLGYIADSPKSEGTLELIVVRPADGERTLLESAKLTIAGLPSWRSTTQS